MKRCENSDLQKREMLNMRVMELAMRPRDSCLTYEETKESGDMALWDIRKGVDLSRVRWTSPPAKVAYKTGSATATGYFRPRTPLG